MVGALPAHQIEREGGAQHKRVLHMLERLLESAQPAYASVGKLLNRKEDIVLTLPNIPPTHSKCSFANGERANLRMITAQPGLATAG